MTNMHEKVPQRTSTDVADDPLIGDVAELLTMWGIPLTPARLYGYLLLQSEPISLEKISTDLGISKTTASDSARLMENFGFLRRYGTRGSKKVRFAPSEYVTNFYAKQISYFKKMSEVFRQRGSSDNPQSGHKDRFEKMAQFYGRLAHAMETTMAEFV